jgi:hypothetical protein
MSLYACARKHQLKRSEYISKWIKMYESENDFLSLTPKSEDEDMGNRSKDSYKEENTLLKKRIKELEKALAFSKLETEARDILIDKAEEYFNVPIRKNSGAKQ